jgi:hypothetical protein
LPGEEGVLWASSKGIRFAGAGEGINLEASGDERLPTLQASTNAFWPLHR